MRRPGRPGELRALAACLSTHARDAVVSSRLAKVLEAVGRDDAVADLLCDVCGLEHLILGLEKASALTTRLHAVALLDRVADLEKMRARLGTKQYITILNQVCLDHMGRGPIVEHVISIFGKLCTEEGAVAIQMEANAPYTLKWALQTHAAAKRLCEKCVLNAAAPRRGQRRRAHGLRLRASHTGACGKPRNAQWRRGLRRGRPQVLWGLFAARPVDSRDGLARRDGESSQRDGAPRRPRATTADGRGALR